MRPALIVAVVAAFLSMAVVFVVKTFAEAVFLGAYGVDLLPHFFVAQAGLLIAAASGYGAIIRRGPGAAFAADLTILGGLAAASIAAPAVVEAGGPWVFAAALSLLTGATLSSMAVWNAVTSVVSGRRSRVFLPRAGAAATSGAVVGGFGASAVVGLAGVEGLAAVAGLASAGSFGLRIALRRLSGEWLAPAEKGTAARPAKTRRSSRRLVALLAGATVAEAVLSAFIDYGFKREVTGAFPGEDAIGLFFSLFYGAMNVLVLATQLSTSARLLASRSLRLSLSASPGALGLLAIAWAAFPALAVAALARGAEGVLKFGVARPSQEVAMTPLSETARKRWKVLLRGVYNQGGAAAAGGLLLVAGPALDLHPAVVPAAAAGVAAVWLLLQRQVARQYLASLESAVGMRRLSASAAEPDERLLDREGLARAVELAGSERDEVAAFGRELLEHGGGDPAALAAHLSSAAPEVRRLLYRRLARTPAKATLPLLQVAARAEPARDGALAEAFEALASLGDPALVERAHTLVEGKSPAEEDPLSRAAWRYLARVGELDEEPEALRELTRATLGTDGEQAATLLSAAAGREVLAWREIEDQLAEAASGGGRAAREALVAAAAIGRTRTLEILLRALEAGAPGLDRAVLLLDGPGLDRILLLAGARGASARARARLLRGLRSSDLPEVSELAARSLLDDSPEVREMAANTLLKRAREARGEVPRRVVERALAAELDRFALYVRARQGFGSRDRESRMEVPGRHRGEELDAETFFLDELERRTERELSKLCSLLALLGHPSSVFGAERALRAPSFKRRRQALDVLQEVARGRQKARLFRLLELYLMPPREPPEGAREAVCAHDAWLARCAEQAEAPRFARVWALRSTLLFDDLPGETVEALAGAAEELELPAAEPVIREGDPGNALYVLMEGAIVVEREGAEVARLGAGQSFGELALLEGRRRQATVRTEAPSRLLRLPQATFDRALDEHPELRIGLLRGLARWLRGDAPAEREPRA